MGKYYPKRHCNMAIAALSILGAKLKIALTSVRSRVRESLPKSANLILLTLYFMLKLTYYLVKSVCLNLKYKLAELRFT